MRSYDITAEIVTGNRKLSDPKATTEIQLRNIPDGFTRRYGKWALHEQTYYFEDAVPGQHSQPEYMGLYQPDV
jgi:hypothetical protein